MFDNLTQQLTTVFSSLRGRKFTEQNIRTATHEVRRALLEADVSLEVVVEFIERVRQKAIGQESIRTVAPGDAFVRIVHEELVTLMGGSFDGLALDSSKTPNVVLLAGLQGAGKTTSAAKLAKYLQSREAKQVALVSADVHRPAAIDQLHVLCDEIGGRFIDSSPNEKPQSIVTRALTESRRHGDDVLIVDTAGRLAVDEEMMTEIASLYDTLSPSETLFVVDAMTGQDAARTARAFHDIVPLTGVVLAKTDGDTRGGAALSVRSVTGAPIKFLGVGEDLDGLETFHPDRIASRILGMGDVLSLIEEAERKVDKKQASRIARKVLKGHGFDLEDMRSQLNQIMTMGGVGNLAKMLPQLNNAKMKIPDENEIKKQIVIINSMTIRERLFPNLLDGSRKKRIAAGSGTDVQDVNLVLRKFKQMQKQVKRVGKLGKKEKQMQQMLQQGFDPNSLS